jgi:diguanylate cyclase (GGDEF)-like protein/PAS domain S-box-containing protein
MPSFRLTRHFSLASLILVLVAAAVLGALVRAHEIAMLEHVAERHSVTHANLFRNLLADDIQALIAESPTTTAENADTVRNFATRLAPLLRQTDVAKLKIYNTHGMTVFSTDAKQIGEDKRTNAAIQAALAGKVSSELVHRDSFSAYDGDRTDIDLLSSYLPFEQGGRVAAVFELYQDVTPLIDDIDRSLWSIGAIVASVIGCLYLLQLVVIRRAQLVIDAQEAALTENNRRLDERVAERSREVETLLKQQQVIIDNAHVGILLLRNRRILRGNQRMAEMFGFDRPEDFIGQTTEVFYGSRERFEAAGRTGYSQLAERGYATFETQMRRRDGTPIWVMQSGRPVNPEAVLEDVSIWIYTDISDLKQAEAEQRIAAVAFESQEGMIVTDADAIVLRVNKAFLELTGYEPEDIVGKKPSLLRSERHDKAFYDAMWQTIRSSGTWSGEIWNRRKDGSVFPAWLTVSTVRNQRGEVTQYVGALTDITERKNAEARIQHLAFFDQLTGLPNRTLLNDRLNQSLAAGERTQRYGAVLFLDLDHFKALNDTAGHDHGDRLLRDAADRLTATIRHSDTVARLGGDEFVIVLNDLGSDAIDAAAAVENTCRKLLEALRMDIRVNGNEFHIGASIGATLFLGTAMPVEELLKQADLAMYKSKEAGRNRFTFFDREMGEAIVRRVRMEAELQRGIREGQFVLHYQPQVHGEHGGVSGAEALIRWNHPERGFVPPDEFIPQAEENGQIVPLGRWVLETACRQLAEWANDADLAHLQLAVNVSVRHFSRDDFVDEVIGILRQTGAPPHRLKIELTESVFVANVDSAIARMKSLRAAGVGFALDDFGTGYSSLASMSLLPLEQIKIDRSFVMTLEDNDNNAAICAATVRLAHTLHMQIVAEGVETEAQRYFLTRVHHCDFLQGYLISRPLPREEFEHFCRSRKALAVAS